MRNTSWIVGGVLSLFAGAANAGVVTIDPNNYAAGQIVTDPTGGATLLAMEAYANPNPSTSAQPYLLQYSPVFAAEVSTQCTGMAFNAPCAPTGNKVFGYAPGGGASSVPILWGQANDAAACFEGDCEFGGQFFEPVLQINFEDPTNFVAVTAGLLTDPDGDLIDAFNSAGQLVGSCKATINNIMDPSGCAIYTTPAWPQLTISNSSDDISTVIIGGDANVRPIAQIQYNSLLPAPEFDERSMCLALTLLLGVLAMLRGRRSAIPTRP